jgi:hypothetical protein
MTLTAHDAPESARQSARFSRLPPTADVSFPRSSPPPTMQARPVRCDGINFQHQMGLSYPVLSCRQQSTIVLAACGLGLWLSPPPTSSDAHAPSPGPFPENDTWPKLDSLPLTPSARGRLIGLTPSLLPSPSPPCEQTRRDGMGPRPRSGTSTKKKISQTGGDADSARG